MSDRPVVDPKRTVKVTELVDPWPDSGYAEPGACFEDKEMVYKDRLIFACPGCGRVGSIKAAGKVKQDGYWQIVEGVLDRPSSLTLHPSIHCVGCCGWHGWINDGIWKSC